MKKVLAAGIIALIIELIGMAVNYFYYQSNGWLLISHKGFGGEITIEHGFGLRVVHIYAMAPGESGSVTLSFSPTSFIVFFIVLFLLVWIILFATEKLQKK